MERSRIVVGVKAIIIHQLRYSPGIGHPFALKNEIGAVVGYFELL